MLRDVCISKGRNSSLDAPRNSTPSGTLGVFETENSSMLKVLLIAHLD